MISWLPVAVVLLVAAITVTTSTPAIAQSSAEPAPGNERRRGAGGARTDLVEPPSPSPLSPRQVESGAADPRHGQVRPTVGFVASASGELPHSEKNRPQQSEEVAAVEQVELAAQEAAEAQLVAGSPTPGAVASSKSAVYTNQFVIQVEGGESEARKLAHKHGFVYLNHILGDYYHLEHRRLSKRSTSATRDTLNISIESEPQVLLLERQVLKRRVKRDFLELTNPANQAPAAVRLGAEQPPSWASAAVASSLRHQHQHQLQSQSQQAQVSRPSSNHAQAQNNKLRLQHHQYTRPPNQAANHLPQRVATGRLLAEPAPPTQVDKEAALSGALGNRAGHLDVLETASTSSSLLFHSANGVPQSAKGANASISMQRPALFSNSSAAHNGNNKQMPFNDPSWPLMWYLDRGAKNGFDLNVMAAWKMGYTGKGIVITILDDGLEKDHPDLQANYDPMASFDINGDDADPMPRYDVNDSNRHGTRCAGEVAAVPDNNICSIGIAYNSKVGGVRMLDGDVTDAVEARSLSLNNQHIHIYSASWGPDDNGKTVDGPGEMATRAFMDGVTNGRQGLGSIFVFASGNGGREHDNCNCDGYTNSIWTLSISSATENGYVPWYIEACSSTLATTYSSGSYEERQIATTDLHHSCTSSHTGTSASAPLAAGICALVLESNPKLTWRDMQHIVVRTAKPANLVAKDWRTNALGRNVSHAFGYGLMDAAAMITMAKRWTTVPMQYTCEVRSPQMEKFIPAKGYIELKLRAACENVRFLEHVQSKVTLTSSRRGDLHIYLISPHGTRSTLLAQRPHDQAEQGFRNWPFMTVHSWGESPNGVWTLEVHNEGKPQNRAYLKEWTLVLHGTQEDPNKHLEAAALAPLPPVSAGLEPHHSVHLRPPAPSNKPPAASGPPPPLPALGNHYPSESESPANPQPAAGPAQPQQPHHGGRPNGGHWSSYQTPPPPPPAPLPPGAMPGPAMRPPSPTLAAPQAPPPPPSTTTTSSYVTTFKTIVSTSSSTPPSPTAPSVTTQSVAGSAQSGGQRVQVNQGQVIKADFEIVSAPGGPQSVQQHNNHNHNNHLHTSTGRPPVETTRPSGADVFGAIPAQESSSQAPPLAGTDKPLVIQLDGNKIDLPMKPPVGSHELLLQQTTSTDQPPPQQVTPPQHELDGNQIDLKLSKDYRSSGDQSLYGTAMTVPTNIENILADPGGQGSTRLGQNGAVGQLQLGASGHLLATFVTLVTSAFIAIFHSHSCNQFSCNHYLNHLHLANTLVRLKV